MESRPFIHCFETSIGKYFYDVNTDKIVKVPEKVYKILKNSKNISMNEEAAEIIKDLKKRGFLKNKHISESIHPMSEFVEDFLNDHIPLMILQVTQQCNLRCEYCVYSGGYENRTHANKYMDLETAKKGIDFLIKHSRGLDRVTIGFYGGEPLLNFKLIQKCVNYAKNTYEGKEISFTITTNGTLLSKEISDFLVSENFSILISLDGPKEIHDQNRKLTGKGQGSFDIIIKNLEELKKRHPDFFAKKVNFNTVLDARRGFSCVSDYISGESFFSENIFVSSLVDTNNKKHIDTACQEFITERKYEEFKVFLYKLNFLDKADVSKIMLDYFDKLFQGWEYSLAFPRSELPEKWHHGGPCIPGGQRLLMNVDGNFYPCERVDEEAEICKIGDIYSGFDIPKIVKILNIEKVTEELCKSCWAYSKCSICISCSKCNQEIMQEEIIKKCEQIRSNAEDDMKDYCTLKELGYEFEAETLNALFENEEM